MIFNKQILEISVNNAIKEYEKTKSADVLKDVQFLMRELSKL